MKLLVLGATGGTGLEILRQALERGHAVTALVRSPERLKTFGERITVIQGDPLSGAELTRAIQGQDAVLSSFGPRVPLAKADRDLLVRFARALTMAMEWAGVRRLVAVSVAFLFKDSIIPPAYLLGRLFFENCCPKMQRWKRSFGGADWTGPSFVRLGLPISRAPANIGFGKAICLVLA